MWEVLLFQRKMAAKKMTMKELSIAVEKLIEANENKDNKIETLNQNISALQNWANEVFSNTHKKLNESDQNHHKNEKILDKKIGEVDLKINRVLENPREDSVEPNKNSKIEESTKYNCRKCSLCFKTKSTLRKHIQCSHPIVVNCDLCEESF